MPNVIAIAKDQVALQLALTGVPVVEVREASEAEQVLAQHLREEGTQLVIVQEEFRAGFSEFFATQLARHRGLPLVVFCPAFDREESDVDTYISSVLKPAVGYEIRLE